MPGNNYALRTNGAEHGVVYTNDYLVDFMLDSVGYLSGSNLSTLTVLEPSAGDGVFVLRIIDRLFKSSQKFGFDFNHALNNIKAYELDIDVANKLRSNINKYCLNHGYTVNEDTLNNMVVCQDFLLPPLLEVEKMYDLVIGNPPYIRYDQIPEKQRLFYRKHFNTFRHRSDIYIAFYEKSLGLLNNNGRLCFVCSNRWMKTKYGEALRQLVVKEYSIDAIIDIEDKAAFDQDVDAYASVTIINKLKAHESHLYYELVNNIKTLNSANLLDKSNVNITNKPVDSNWHIGDLRSFAISKEYTLIEQQGYRIGIGVASGADKVFIGKFLPIEDELKLPIVIAREIKDGEINWLGRYIFNPYNADGSLINLEQYPYAKAYLIEHEAILKGRHTAKKSNVNSWYKTIDRIYPELASRPKLLIPDMKKDGLFPIDDGRYYPHHNIYYVTHPDIDSLKLLGSFLISDFCIEQINLVSVKMRGGFARWQSQNLRKVVLPNINSIEKNIKNMLIMAYDRKDRITVNKIVNNLISEIT